MSLRPGSHARNYIRRGPTGYAQEYNMKVVVSEKVGLLCLAVKMVPAGS